MGFFSKLIGLALLVVGVYFLGQNVIFTTQTSVYWWRSIPATGSVLSILGGVLFLLYGRRSNSNIGWILVGLGILLVFLSGGVILRPTSLWSLFLALVSMVGGYQLLTTGRFNL